MRGTAGTQSPGQPRATAGHGDVGAVSDPESVDVARQRPTTVSRIGTLADDMRSAPASGGC